MLKASFPYTASDSEKQKVERVSLRNDDWYEGETQVRRTAMLWRNMAASFANFAALVIPGAPVLTGTFRGRPMGCGTEVWRL